MNDYYKKAEEYLKKSQNEKDEKTSAHYYSMYVEMLFKGDQLEEKENGN